MKFFVLGDTHHKLEKAYNVSSKLKNIDMIIHTGDHVPDAHALSEKMGIPVVSVPGNCDGRRSYEDFEIVETECGKLLVTHGHMQSAKKTHEKLIRKAKKNGCMAVIFGHTHRPLFEKEDGIYLINPGSLTRPRDETDGSYALLTTSKNGLSCSIKYYGMSMKDRLNKSIDKLKRKMTHN